MKHILLIAALAAFLSVFSGCNAPDKTGSSFPEGTFGKEASYALGMNIGTSLKTDNIYPNMEEFIQGMKDALSDSMLRYSMEEAYQIFTDELYKESRQAENDFLAENSTKPGIKVTASGLQYEVISEGTGTKPTVTDKVQVHYEGALINGTVFDSSYSRGEPIEFFLFDVISGWAEGLQLMNVGAKYRLIIPSDLGYGHEGAGGGQIPPYATLIFEVELLDIVQ